MMLTKRQANSLKAALLPSPVRKCEQEIGEIALGIDDDDDLMLAGGVLAADVLRDEQLGEPCLAHARRAQHQGMPDALAERQTDVHFLRLDAV